MVKIILILSITIISYSCEDEYSYVKNRQTIFINNLLNKPDELVVTIKEWNSTSTYPINFCNNLINQDDVKPINDLLKKIKKYGYSIEFLDPWMFRESETRKIHFCNEILVKANYHDLLMIFRFQTENNKFILINIDTNKSSLYQRKKDLSLRDTVLMENGNFIKLICNDPENLINIIDNSEYFSARYREVDMPDDTLKFYSQHLKSLTEFGYEIYDRSTNYFGEDINIPGLSIVIDDEVVIKAKGKEIYLSLLFKSKNDKEVLCHMYNDKRTISQQVREFQHPNE